MPWVGLIFSSSHQSHLVSGQLHSCVHPSAYLQEPLQGVLPSLTLVLCRSLVQLQTSCCRTDSEVGAGSAFLSLLCKYLPQDRQRNALQRLLSHILLNLEKEIREEERTLIEKY